MEACTEVEEPIVTLKVSCWSKADSGFCAGLRGVLWKGFLSALAYAPNSIFQCLLKSMVVPIMSVQGEIVQDIPLFAGSALSHKTVFSTMQDIILFGNFRYGSEFHTQNNTNNHTTKHIPNTQYPRALQPEPLTRP